MGRVLFRNLPLCKPLFRARIVYANLYDFSTVALVGDWIIHAVDLPHRFFSRTVYFELEDVDCVMLPYNRVASPFAISHFTNNEFPHKLKNKPNKRLAIKLVAFLVCFFRSAGKNVVDSLHKFVDFAGAELFDKVKDFYIIGLSVIARIKGSETVIKPIFHFFIWKP